MHHRLQFGARENPASERRHGSRQAVRSVSNATRLEEPSATQAAPACTQNHSTTDVESRPNTAPRRAAAGGVKNLTSEHGVHAHAGTPRFEPSIKTLQRGTRQQGNPEQYRIEEIKSMPFDLKPTRQVLSKRAVRVIQSAMRARVAGYDARATAHE